MARGKSNLEDGEADAFDESDQDSRMNEDEESFDENDLDDELELPPELRNISLEEKKELYRFKRERSEIEWEQEIDARVQRLSKKIDLQRLKEMHGGAAVSEKQKKTSSARKPTTKRGRAQALESDEEASENEQLSAKARTPSQRGGRRKAIADTDEDEEAVEEETDSKKKKSFARKVVYEEQKMSEEEEEPEEEKEEEKEKSKAKAQTLAEKDSDEESLFDSEEEDLITDKYKTKREQDEGEEFEDEDEDEAQKSKKRQRPTPKLKKQKKTTKRSKKDYSDESEAEDEEEEDEDDALSDAGETNIKHIKEQFRGVAETRSGRARENKEDTFESLAELRNKLLSKKKQDIEAAEDDFQPAELQDYQKLALRRDQLVALLNEPFFADYVQGCFVRYSLGEIDRKPIYRLCEIVRVENDSKKTYKIPSPTGHGEVETAVRFTLSTGGAVREKAKLDRVSNHSLQQNELDNHLQDLEKRGFAPPTKRDIKLRRARQKEFRNYSYKTEEIKTMVDNKVGFNKVLSTEYSNAMETLLKKRDDARRDRDDEALKKIEKAIEALEAENDRQRQVFETVYKKQIDLNKRSRDNNVRRDMEAGMRKRKEDLEAQAKGVLPNAVADPFIRRETRPKILWKSTQSLSTDKSAAANPATPRPVAAQTSAAANKTNSGAEQSSSATNAHSQQTADKDEFIISDDIDMEQVRQRVAGYLGFDFLAEAMKSEKQKYLERACAHLPSRGSAAREILRGDHISLVEYIKTHFETATEA